MWFELARNPIFALFDPDMRLSRETFPLIMAHTDYDYIAQLYFQFEVEIHTWISRIGNKSLTTYHEAWQQGRLCVRGNAVMVHYNFSAEQSMPLSDEMKQILSRHLKSD